MGVEQEHVDGVAVRVHRSQRPDAHRPPIVMIHGGSHASWCWDPWAGHLSSKGYDCIAFDWFNHGESSHQPVDAFCNRSIQDVASKELESIRGMYRQQRRPFVPIVIGHSMGALAALAYAAKSLSDVHKLVLVAPVVPMQAKADPIAVDVTFGEPFAPPPFGVAKQLFFTTMSEGQARTLYKRLEPESPRAVWEATRSTTWVPLVNVTCPTLVVTARQDALLPPSNGAALATLLRAGPPVELAGLGHSDVLLRKDRWRDGADTVLDWIESR